MRDWRTWALLLPLGAVAAARRHPAGHQGRARNLAEPDRGGPDRLYLLDADGAHGRAHPHRPLHRARRRWRGRLWFALIGICNGIGTLLLYAALGAGPVSLVAPLYATYPLVTVGLSALVLGNVEGHVSRLRRRDRARPSAAWC